MSMAVISRARRRGGVEVYPATAAAEAMRSVRLRAESRRWRRARTNAANNAAAARDATTNEGTGTRMSATRMLPKRRTVSVMASSESAAMIAGIFAIQGET